MHSLYTKVYISILLTINFDPGRMTYLQLSLNGFTGVKTVITEFPLALIINNIIYCNYYNNNGLFYLFNCFISMKYYTKSVNASTSMEP